MWIPLFGCWKKDFNKIQQKTRFIDLQLMQVDWTFQIVSQKKAVINFFELYDIFELKNKSGGYNIFKVFSQNYLNILKFLYKKKSFLNELIILKRKNYYLIINTKVYYVGFAQKSYNFNNDSKFKYLKDYKRDWYFYVALSLILPYFIIYTFVFLARKISAKNIKLYNF
jgi:hypothetical protein